MDDAIRPAPGISGLTAYSLCRMSEVCCKATRYFQRAPRSCGPVSPGKRGFLLPAAAFGLLTRGRPVLVELGAGEPVRFRGRVSNVRPGSSLHITLLDSIARFRSDDRNVNVVVLVSHCRWSFPAKLIEAPDDDAPVLTTSWPAQVHQLDGRRSDRLKMAIPLRCRIAHDGGGAQPWFATYCLDLNASGLRLAFPAPLELGTGIVMELHLLGRRMPAIGKVVWAQPIVEQKGDPMFAIGVEFVEVTQAARLRLRAIVREGI